MWQADRTKLHNLWLAKVLLAHGICCLFFTLVPSIAISNTVHGQVRGGGEANNIYVVGLPTRNLRALDARAKTQLVYAPVDRNTGRFSLPLIDDSKTPTYLLVAHQCSEEALQKAALHQCRLYFPIQKGLTESRSKEDPLIVPLPDLQAAQAVWMKAPLTGGTTLRAIGFTLLGLLVFLALWIRRAGGSTHDRETAVDVKPSNWRKTAAILAGLSALLIVPGLGSETLDLLEFSYFHEGVRPANASAVITDYISTELAHGPVMPLVLRGINSLSSSPWLLRLPSALFGLAFVILVAAISYRRLGLTAAWSTGALALVLPLTLYYARDATPYALTGLCSALSIWIIVNVVDSDKPAYWWSAFAIVHIVGFFSHYMYAFVPISEFIALTVAWYKTDRRQLGSAWLAFAVAAILPTLMMPSLVHMIESSGIQFSLMSSIYPESPGILSFFSSFTAVVTGIPTWFKWGLIVTLPLWGVGLHVLWKRSRILAWIVIVQTVFIGIFVVFTHTMSTSVGGDRIFYAFRWTRPLLLASLLPIGAAILFHRHLRWLVGLIVLVALAQSVAMVTTPQRPSQQKVADIIRESAKPGDAYAVLPAAFYGDPLQYYLANGNPPQLLTNMRPRSLDLSGTSIWGPLMESALPFETVMDNLSFNRIWVVVYREAMFGVLKFDPNVATRALDNLPSECEAKAVEPDSLSFVDVYLVTCSPKRGWDGGDSITIALDGSLSSERFLVPPLSRFNSSDKMHRTRLRVPSDAEHLTVHAGAMSSVTKDDLHISPIQGAIQYSVNAQGRHIWKARLGIGNKPPIVSVRTHNAMTRATLVVEVSK
jgi:hypothetical protein